ILRGYIVAFAEVGLDVIQLPDIFAEVRCAGIFPGQAAVTASSDPAVVIDGSIPEHLEALRAPCPLFAPIGKAIKYAQAFNRLLPDAVDLARLLDVCGFQDRGCKIDDVMELPPHAARVLDFRRPRNNQWIARAPEV